MGENKASHANLIHTDHYRQTVITLFDMQQFELPATEITTEMINK